jgi:predicted nucleic acid-binding Zn ribbon protein
MPHSTGWRGRKDPRTLEATAIGEIVEGLMRERAFSWGVPIGTLAADWASVVGPRVAAESAPVSLDNGVLVVATTTGPWGAQVRFLADQIRERANEALGGEGVVTVRVVVREESRKTL